MNEFLIEVLFNDLPYIIIFAPDIDAIMNEIEKRLERNGYKNQTVILDLLLRNGPSDRFFQIELVDGKLMRASCEPIALSLAEFEKTYEYYKSSPKILDYGCYKLNAPQKFLMRQGSVKQLYRNYCYYEKGRQQSYGKA